MDGNWIECWGVNLTQALYSLVNAAKYREAYLQGYDLPLIPKEKFQPFEEACEHCHDLYFLVASFEGMPLKLRFERANKLTDSISVNISRVDVSQYDQIYGHEMGRRALDKVRGPHIMAVAAASKKRLFGNTDQSI